MKRKNAELPAVKRIVEVQPASAAPMQLAWNDFHLVLTVARQASLARASTALGVTHVTMLRKLAAIESRLNTRLFDRMRGRYTLTPAGETVAQAAMAFEPHAREAELHVLGQDLRPSGLVRVAVAGVVIDHLLVPLLKQFASAFPQVCVELVASRDHLSLARREADVAIRITDSVSDWLVGRRLGSVGFRVYGLKRGAAPALCAPSELSRLNRWISFEQDARDLKFDRWLHHNVPEDSVAMRVDNFSHALTMVSAGLGIALLPSFLEATCPQLQPLTPLIDELQTPMWLVTHQELRSAMRVKVMMQAFGPALSHALRPGS